MTRAELEANWQITRRHLESAKALLSSPLQENQETGARVSLYSDFLSQNELGLALEILVALGEANCCSAQFWQEVSTAAKNMGLKHDYPIA